MLSYSITSVQRKILNKNIEKEKDCKKGMKFVLNVSCIYHKIKAECTWKHTFLYHTCHILYFYCILGPLQHKNEVNIVPGSICFAPNSNPSTGHCPDLPGVGLSGNSESSDWCCSLHGIGSPLCPSSTSPRSSPAHSTSLV